MQTGIALSGFLLLKLFENQFYRWSISFYYLFYPFGFPWIIGLPHVMQKASNTQAHLRRYSPPIKSALVEFHKAQCFFILAIEIAANIVVRKGTLNDGTTPTTLQGLFNNYSLVGSVSISGFVPVTFTLLALHHAGIRSWYLLTLSNCALVLSAVTLFSVGEFVISQADMQRLNEANAAGSYRTCGYKDPTAFCLDRGYDISLDTGYHTSLDTNLTSMNFGYGSIGGAGLLFTCIILALINLDYFGLQRTSKYEGFVKWLSRTLDAFLRIIQERKSDRSAQHLLTRSKDCLHLFIWGWYLTLIGFSLTGLNHPSNGPTLTPVMSWTFGQIVAITVWAGPLFEFVKLSVRKYW